MFLQMPQERRILFFQEKNAAGRRKSNPFDAIIYGGVAAKDYQDICNEIITVMNSDLEWRFPRNLVTYVDSLEDSVEASVFKEEGESDTIIRLSRGLMFAIEDLSCRLFVNKDFFSLQALAQPERIFDPGPDDHTGIWPCKYSLFKPKSRFFDYAPKVNDLPQSELEGNTWLYQFITALPIVPQRLRLADLSIMIATTWVIAHEQSHAKKGHLSFNGNGRCEANLKSPNYQIPELKPENLPEVNYDKLMEFEADRDAIRCVIDIFFNEIIASHLPDACEKNRAVWLLRLILGSVNNVLLILQNARINYWRGNPDEPDLPHPFDDHPTPRTRIFAMYSSLMERLEENSWSDVMNITEYDFFEGDFFFKLLFDSLLDLNTASEIFSREANQQNRLHTWEEKIRPVFEPQKILHTLGDDGRDVLLVTELFYKGIFPNDPGFRSFNKPENAERLKELSALWFDEYNNELMPGFRFIVNGGFQKFS